MSLFCFILSINKYINGYFIIMSHYNLLFHYNSLIISLLFIFLIFLYFIKIIIFSFIYR